MDGLAGLQLLGLVITCAVGVIGLLTEFRDAGGRVTRGGRANLSLLLVGGLIAISAQIGGIRKERAASLEAERRYQAENGRAEELVQRARELTDRNDVLQEQNDRIHEQNEQIKHEFARSLNPLARVRIQGRVSVAGDHPALGDYGRWLNDEIVALWESGPFFYMRGEWPAAWQELRLRPSSFGANGDEPTLSAVAIEGDSRLTENLPESLGALFSLGSAHLAIYQQPRDLEDHDLLGGPLSTEADVAAQLTEPVGMSVFEWDFSDQRFTLEFDLSVDVTAADGTGEVRSVLDLRGAQVGVTLWFLELTRAGLVMEPYHQLVHDLRIDRLSVNLGTKRSLSLTEEAAFVGRNQRGRPVRIVELPDEQDAFRERLGIVVPGF